RLIPDLDTLDDSIADYLLLHKLAEVCSQKIGSGSEDELECVQEIAKVINLLYQGGNQYTRNAIENEFLTALSFEESPGSLKKTHGFISHRITKRIYQNHFRKLIK
ncbi:MAG TPA: hypothetical protein PLS00_18515, partial [Niabella sp.]|nr:hypothetical protein [Niabella sp.]